MSDDGEANGGDRRARGEAMFEQVYGGVVALPPREGRSTYVTNTIEQLFAEVWSRDVLSVAQRRLLILGAMIAMGEAGILEIQLRAALAKGELSREQVEELLIFMVHYVGYPRASVLQQLIQRVLADPATPA